MPPVVMASTTADTLDDAAEPRACPRPDRSRERPRTRQRLEDRGRGRRRGRAPRRARPHGRRVPALGEIAEAKAAGTALWHRDGEQLAASRESHEGFFDAVSTLARLPLIPGPGAVLIRSSEGVLGAAGASGASGDDDRSCFEPGLRPSLRVRLHCRGVPGVVDPACQALRRTSVRADVGCLTRPAVGEVYRWPTTRSTTRRKPWSLKHALNVSHRGWHPSRRDGSSSTPLTPPGSTTSAYGGVCIFESDEFVLRGRPDLTAYEKPNAGFTIRVVPPGRPVTLYHAESVEEDFLVLMGECVLIIEDQERHLRAWDFVHCPPMTAHAFVATEAGPCVILATGNRRDDLERVSPRSEVALRYDAGPERRGRWEVRRPGHWDGLPWAEQP